MKSVYKKLIASAVAATFCVTYLLAANKSIGITEFTVTSSEIPDSLDGFRIVHVSDLHNESFGRNNEKLLSEIKSLNPDAIAITGDIIDSRRTDISVAVAFTSQAVKIAPVYYVTGNHEFRTAASESLFASMEKQGVSLLRGERLTVKKEDGSVSFYGIDDPRISGDYLGEYEAEKVRSDLEGLDRGEDFSILLSHRPEFFDIYSDFGFDLVLSGHAHAGQFRLPFIGGTFAPGQGFFPEYDSGIYRKNATAMIVSRGLGNSVIPLRVNNNPELISITLIKEVQ